MDDLTFVLEACFVGLAVVNVIAIGGLFYFFILKELKRPMPLDYTSMNAAVDKVQTVSTAAITQIQAMAASGSTPNPADQAALEALAQKLGVTMDQLQAVITAAQTPAAPSA